MIDLEERIGAVLDSAAATVSPRPLQPARPLALARRRRRNRRIGQVAVALLAVVGLGAALQLTADTGTSVETADERGLDADGVPVDTGPELEWRQESSAADLGIAEVVWSGERFIAIGGEDQTQIFGSVDGRDWTSLPDGVSGGLPDDLTLQRLTASGGRLFAWGVEPADSFGAWPIGGPIRLVASDDHGSTWRELGEVGDPPIDDDPHDYLTRSDFIEGVAASGDTVIVLTSSWEWPSVTEALADRGLIDSGDDVVVQTLEASRDAGEVEATYCVNPAPAGDCGDETASIEFEVRGIEGQLIGEESTVVWRSVGGSPFDRVEEIEGGASRLVTARDRWFLLSWRDRWQLLGSDDGRVWTPIELEGPLTDLASDGQDVVVAGWSDGAGELHRSSDGGRTWVSSQLPIGPHDVVVGPGGEATTGAVAPEDVGIVRDFMNWVSGRGQPEQPQLVGWSADGIGWGWQTSSEAFGTGGWAPIAIGEDTAVALVWPEHDESLGPDVPSLFVADLRPS